ncbi:type II toxin-antitoxin system RelE/ParE family toxin [Methylobacterium sp. J-048]|nr:type II toxin-antitoxin system RelE/ParE family toxin [Methylobacterium sp. J-048]
MWAYVAADASPAMADRLIARIEAACAPVRDFPQAGPSREQLAPGLRVVIERAYAIYYQHDEREIVIVRVLHGARDVDALAAHGGFA